MKDVHRFGRLDVMFEYSPDGGFMIHHDSESSLVVERKLKQHLNKPLMELKKSVMGKLNESFSFGIWCLEALRKVV